MKYESAQTSYTGNIFALFLSRYAKADIIDGAPVTRRDVSKQRHDWLFLRSQRDQAHLLIRARDDEFKKPFFSKQRGAGPW